MSRTCKIKQDVECVCENKQQKKIFKKSEGK